MGPGKLCSFRYFCDCFDAANGLWSGDGEGTLVHDDGGAGHHDGCQAWATGHVDAGVVDDDHGTGWIQALDGDSADKGRGHGVTENDALLAGSLNDDVLARGNGGWRGGEKGDLGHHAPE